MEDTDDIPTHEEAENGYKNPEYFFRVNIGGVTEDSGLLKFKDWVEFVFKKPDGTPVKNMKIKILSPEGKSMDETTNEDGVIQIKDIPPGKLKID